MVTDKPEAERSEISAFFKANGFSELSVPKTIKHVDTDPLLGTGKIDYVGVKEIVIK